MIPSRQGFINLQEEKHVRYRAHLGAEVLQRARETKAPDLISIKPHIKDEEKERAEDPGR